MILRSNHFYKHRIYEGLDEAETEKAIIRPAREEALVVVPPISAVFNKSIRRGKACFNPFSAICTCADSVKKREIFPAREIHTLCGHLRKYYRETQSGPDFQLFNCMAEAAVKFSIEQFYSAFGDEKNYMFGYSSGSIWLTVFAAGKTWECYGFNLNQRRWARGIMPEDREVIEQLIGDYFLTDAPSL